MWLFIFQVVASASFWVHPRPLPDGWEKLRPCPQPVPGVEVLGGCLPGERAGVP